MGRLEFLGTPEQWEHSDLAYTFGRESVRDLLAHPDTRVISTTEVLHAIHAEIRDHSKVRSWALCLVNGERVLADPADHQVFHAVISEIRTRDAVLYSTDPAVFADLDWPVWTLPTPS